MQQDQTVGQHISFVHFVVAISRLLPVKFCQKRPQRPKFVNLAEFLFEGMP